MELIPPVVIFGLSIIAELLIISLLPKEIKPAKLISLIAIILVIFPATSILILYFSFFSIILFLINMFRVINLGRVAIARMNPQELTSRYDVTAGQLGILSVFALILSIYAPDISVIPSLVIISLAGSCVLFINTIYSLQKWRAQSLEMNLESKLPTVSICIPARNETQDLPECIESILSSTYPKLEILVLDDCSHDKTPTIIKEYAHQGVRFISGEEPDDDWLAKNQAMNKLFKESKGEIVVFAGVDTRFSTDTVTQMVANLQNGVEMIGIMPKRSPGHEYTVFIQPLRYWWELSVPRLFGGRPPILSTCWAINRKSLKNLGGFASFRHSVQPEAHFAKLMKSNYRFIISGRRLGITSVKHSRDQFDTAIRTRYPQTKRRPETVFYVFVAEFIILFIPLFGVAYGFMNKDSLYILLLSLFSTLLLIVTNILISRLADSKLWILGISSLPFLICEEWYILIRSMLAYEFGTVIWKERNICLPMLQVDKQLPKV